MLDPFPVLEELTLDRAQRRWHTFRRRDAAELPEPKPGTELVFYVDGRYQRPPGGLLRLDDPVVTGASTVARVDLRAREITVNLPVASPVRARDLVLRIGVLCQVSDSGVVAQQRLQDLSPLLFHYFGEDQRLRWIAATFATDEINAARQQVERRVTARFEVEPPQVPGMELSLTRVRLSHR